MKLRNILASARSKNTLPGYFDELGITVVVTAETSDDEILSLKDRIAPVLLESRVWFKWMLLFERCYSSLLSR